MFAQIKKETNHKNAKTLRLRLAKIDNKTVNKKLQKHKNG